MKRSALATLALSLLALLFGWETRQALRATPGGQENAAPAAGAWKAGFSASDPQPPPDPTAAATAVSARPLFRPDRQPFREPVSGGSGRNYEAELSRFTLLGVLGFGDAPVGVVTSKAGNKVDRWELKAGDPLPGFTVKEVRMDGLLLAADEREFLLPLYAGPPTAATGASRTEVPRRDAAPNPVVPPASAVPSRPAGPAPAGTAPGVSPAPFPAGRQPAGTPRYVPGRR